MSQTIYTHICGGPTSILLERHPSLGQAPQLFFFFDIFLFFFSSILSAYFSFFFSFSFLFFFLFLAFCISTSTTTAVYHDRLYYNNKDEKKEEAKSTAKKKKKKTQFTINHSRSFSFSLFFPDSKNLYFRTRFTYPSLSHFNFWNMECQV